MSAPNKSYDPVEVEALKPEEIAARLDEALAAIAAAGDLDALAQAKIAHTGGTSPLALANREIGALPPQAKAEAGKRVGQARGRVNQALKARQEELEAERDARVLVEEAVDVTLPYDRTPAGARHPLTTFMERVADVFVAMGYEVAEGPEVEAEWFNFDALNFVPDHPARQMQDTFFVQGGGTSRTESGGGTETESDSGSAADSSGVVLRTHTSPVQARTLVDREPPVYVVCPGRVYRTDELDATHSPVFHQIELLAVDEGLTMADLKGTLDHMVRALFGPDMKTRLRPNYFPFTEPSAEMDMVCYVCRGESVGNPDRPCRTCSSEGWIELGGCGMVNPKVLIACGVDPEKYSGFAFGFGIDRMLMFRHNVEDMRDMFEGDVRFTRPFGMEI
ncbi:phenylalanine--tRNA ligase subunit alpha [Streptomyces platensis]|uniref:phenylalanine--tRNA ligase subunit alpha n=1 Tax=Streptomyces platensis TaxID=58346 RepID=UPI003C2BE03A